MTRKEAIKEPEILKQDYWDDDDTMTALDMAIEVLNQSWIPVSEKLPEANRAVLTYIDTGATKTYCLANWNDVREAWEEWIGYDLIEKDKYYKVIAWMPLPEPYKAESEGEKVKKFEFVERAEKDMEFEAGCVVERLIDYAERKCIEYDFICETFLKAFHKRVKESEGEE